MLGAQFALVVAGTGGGLGPETGCGPAALPTVSVHNFKSQNIYYYYYHLYLLSLSFVLLSLLLLLISLLALLLLVVVVFIAYGQCS